MLDNHKSNDRSWQDIVAEMNVEQDTKKLLQLAKELDQAMQEEEREKSAKEIRIGQPARCLRHCMAALSAEDERWRSLCERAGNEQDLEKRIELVREINRTLIEWLLQEKDRLNLIPTDHLHFALTSSDLVSRNVFST